MKLLSLPLAFMLLSLACAKCPVGTVQGVNVEDCYYFDPSLTMWRQVGTSSMDPVSTFQCDKRGRSRCLPVDMLVLLIRVLSNISQFAFSVQSHPVHGPKSELVYTESLRTAFGGLIARGRNGERPA